MAARPVIPSRLSGGAVEHIRRNSALSIATDSRLNAIRQLFSRLSAYGGIYIDSTSAPYTIGPTVITNWDDAYPGAGGADALNTTLDATAGTITINLAGVYIVSGTVSGDGTAGADYIVDLYLDGVRVIGFSIDQSNQSSSWTLSFSFMVDLIAGDVLDLRLTAGGSTTIENAVFSVSKAGLVQEDIDSIQ